MWRPINAYWRRQKLDNILEVEIDRNGTWNCRETQSAVEIGIAKKKSEWFLLTYGTPIMKNGTIHHELGTLEYTESADRNI